MQDLQLILDYIVINEDRHFGNLGMIRNTNTGEWLEPAPIFDTGSSLFYNSMKLHPKHIDCKPFHKDFDKQIQYVDLSLYKESIESVAKSVDDIFYESFDGCFEGNERIEQLFNAVQSQIRKLLA